MKRTFITNGKITYPQNGQALTAFTFINQQTGDMFNISTMTRQRLIALITGKR